MKRVSKHVPRNKQVYDKLARVRNYTANGDGVTWHDKVTGHKMRKNQRSHTFTVEGSYRAPANDNSAHWHSYRKSNTINLVDTVEYGNNIPGWRDKLRTGIGVVTTLSGVKQTLKVSYGGIASSGILPNTYKIGSEDNMTGPFGALTFVGMPGTVTSISSTALQQARTRLLQSYLSQVQSFSGGKFLAELKDSIELVLHPVHSVYKKTWDYAKTVKKLGRIYQHRPRTLAAALSESWLAFSFGVKPFLQDANDAATALNKLVQDPRGELRYVSGTGHERAQSRSSTTVPGGDSAQANVNVINTTDLSVRFRGAFRQKPVGTANLLSEFGLSVLDIAPSIWEGIPWSFFVDYFSNVSECLDAWRMIFVDQAWLIRTVRNRSTKEIVPGIATRSDPPPGRFYSQSGDFGCTGVTTYINRTATSFFAETPTFHFKLPGTNASRLLNITSLIGVINDSRWGTRPNSSR